MKSQAKHAPAAPLTRTNLTKFTTEGSLTNEDQIGSYTDGVDLESAEGTTHRTGSAGSNYPYQLLKNTALAHFWRLYFEEKDLVHWSLFEAKLLIHLSSAADTSSDPSDLPVPPSGYGLQELEIYKLFYYKSRHLMRNLLAALDYSKSQMVSVRILAQCTNHLNPSTELKHVIYYLSCQLIRTNLLSFHCSEDVPVSSVAMHEKLVASYSAIIDNREDVTDTLYGDTEGDSAPSNFIPIHEKSVFTPFEFASEDVLGYKHVQDELIALLTHSYKQREREYGLLHHPCSTGITFHHHGPSGSASGGAGAALLGMGGNEYNGLWLPSQDWIVIGGKPMFGKSVRVQAALKSILHSNIIQYYRRLSAEGVAAGSNWSNAAKEEEDRNPWSSATKEYPKESLLWDVMCLDLRGLNQKNEVYTAFLNQCMLIIDPFEKRNNLMEIEAAILKFVKSLRMNSVLLLDHVSAAAVTILKKLLHSVGNRIQIIVIPEIPITASIVSAQLSAAEDESTSAALSRLTNSRVSSQHHFSDYYLYPSEMEYELVYDKLFAEYLALLGIHVTLETIQQNRKHNAADLGDVNPLPRNVYLYQSALSTKDAKQLITSALQRNGSIPTPTPSEASDKSRLRSPMTMSPSRPSASAGAGASLGPSPEALVDMISQMTRGCPHLILLVCRQPVMHICHLHNLVQARNSVFTEYNNHSLTTVTAQDIFFPLTGGAKSSPITSLDAVLIRGCYAPLYFMQKLHNNMLIDKALLWELTRDTFTTVLSQKGLSSKDDSVKSQWEESWQRLTSLGWFMVVRADNLNVVFIHESVVSQLDLSLLLPSDGSEKTHQSSLIVSYVTTLLRRFSALNRQLSVYECALSLPDVTINSCTSHLKTHLLTIIDQCLQHYNVLCSFVYNTVTMFTTLGTAKAASGINDSFDEGDLRSVSVDNTPMKRSGRSSSVSVVWKTILLQLSSLIGGSDVMADLGKSLLYELCSEYKTIALARAASFQQMISMCKLFRQITQPSAKLDGTGSPSILNQSRAQVAESKLSLHQYYSMMIDLCEIFVSVYKDQLHRRENAGIPRTSTYMLTSSKTILDSILLSVKSHSKYFTSADTEHRVRIAYLLSEVQLLITAAAGLDIHLTAADYGVECAKIAQQVLTVVNEVVPNLAKNAQSASALGPGIVTAYEKELRELQSAAIADPVVESLLVSQTRQKFYELSAVTLYADVSFLLEESLMRLVTAHKIAAANKDITAGIQAVCSLNTPAAELIDLHNIQHWVELFRVPVEPIVHPMTAEENTLRLIPADIAHSGPEAAKKSVLPIQNSSAGGKTERVNYYPLIGASISCRAQGFQSKVLNRKYLLGQSTYIDSTRLSNYDRFSDASTAEVAPLQELLTSLCTTAIEIYNALFTENSLLSTTVLTALGDIYRAFNNTPAAKECYEKVLKICKFHTLTNYTLPTMIIADSFVGLSDCLFNLYTDKVELAIRILEEGISVLRIVGYAYSCTNYYTTTASHSLQSALSTMNKYITIHIRNVHKKRDATNSKEDEDVQEELYHSANVLRRYNMKLVATVEELVLLLRYSAKEYKYRNLVNNELMRQAKLKAASLFSGSAVAGALQFGRSRSLSSGSLHSNHSSDSAAMLMEQFHGESTGRTPNMLITDLLLLNVYDKLCKYVIKLASVQDVNKNYYLSIPLFKYVVGVFKEMNTHQEKMNPFIDQVVASLLVKTPSVGMSALTLSSSSAQVPPPQAPATAQNELMSQAQEILDELSEVQHDNNLINIGTLMCILSRSMYLEGLRIVGGSGDVTGLEAYKDISDISLSSLQNVYNNRVVPGFHYKQALHLMSQAIRIYKDMEYEKTGLYLYRSYKLLANYHLKQYAYTEAKACYDDIMKLFMEKKFVTYHEIALTQFEYANILLCMHEYSEASLLLQQSIDSYEKIFKSTSFRTGEYLLIDERIAISYMLMGMCKIELLFHEEAQRNIVTALNIFKESYSLPMMEIISQTTMKNSPYHFYYKSYTQGVSFVTNKYVANCYNLLATVHHYYEEHQEGITNYEYAMKIYELCDMKESMEMSNVFNNLATLYDDMGKNEEAQTCYEKALVILLRNHGKCYHQILITLENLMNLLSDLNKKQEQQSIEEHVAEIEKRLIQSIETDNERSLGLNKKLYSVALEKQAHLQIITSKRRGVNAVAKKDVLIDNNLDTEESFSVMQPEVVVIHDEDEVDLDGGDVQTTDYFERSFYDQEEEFAYYDNGRYELDRDTLHMELGVLKSAEAGEANRKSGGATGLMGGFSLGGRTRNRQEDTVGSGGSGGGASGAASGSADLPSGNGCVVM